MEKDLHSYWTSQEQYLKTLLFTGDIKQYL